MKMIREATSDEMNEVYMMGYDVWGDDLPSNDYINMCSESSKYKKGRWYVLEETNTKELLSSLIIYELPSSEGFIARGIGSIATPRRLRQNGYASLLIKEVIAELEQHENCNLCFLYTDIGTTFYKQLQFLEIPSSKQKYQGSTCMYYSSVKDVDVMSFPIPEYF
ncbi:GNAT family N-acetyltransferase [Bacillus sp. REN10]|uniref:GNAT family N-acetyltransferase n=1 Tax=Bacillus sp. REN10 TaxID=2782541 RepID=UPI00193B241A|nr:GNAT family N-acetyltransferase [Bacillus sp. REN10]